MEEFRVQMNAEYFRGTPEEEFLETLVMICRELGGYTVHDLVEMDWFEFDSIVRALNRVGEKEQQKLDDQIKEQGRTIG